MGNGIEQSNVIKKKKRKLGCFAWLIGILVVAAIIGKFGGKDDTTASSTNATTSPVVVSNTKSSKDFKDADVTSDSVKAAIESRLGKTANTEKKPLKVTDVTVNDDLGDGIPKGNKIVILTLNGNDNPLVDERKVLLMDSKDVLQTLAANPSLYELDVDWQLPFVDTYGNVKDDLAMQLKFTRPQIDKINWDNFLYDNIPIVAKDSGYYWEHPALTKK